MSQRGSATIQAHRALGVILRDPWMSDRETYKTMPLKGIGAYGPAITAWPFQGSWEPMSQVQCVTHVPGPHRPPSNSE